MQTQIKHLFTLLSAEGDINLNDSMSTQLLIKGGVGSGK